MAPSHVVTGDRTYLVHPLPKGNNMTASRPNFSIMSIAEWTTMVDSDTAGCCAWDRGEAGFAAACPSCKANNEAPDCGEVTSTGPCRMAVSHAGPCNWGN